MCEQEEEDASDTNDLVLLNPSGAVMAEEETVLVVKYPANISGVEAVAEAEGIRSGREAEYEADELMRETEVTAEETGVVEGGGDAKDNERLQPQSPTYDANTVQGPSQVICEKKEDVADMTDTVPLYLPSQVEADEEMARMAINSANNPDAEGEEARLDGKEGQEEDNLSGETDITVEETGGDRGAGHDDDKKRLQLQFPANVANPNADRGQNQLTCDQQEDVADMNNHVPLDPTGEVDRNEGKHERIVENEDGEKEPAETVICTPLKNENKDEEGEATGYCGADDSEDGPSDGHADEAIRTEAVMATWDDSAQNGEADSMDLADAAPAGLLTEKQGTIVERMQDNNFQPSADSYRINGSLPLSPDGTVTVRNSSSLDTVIEEKTEEEQPEERYREKAGAEDELSEGQQWLEEGQPTPLYDEKGTAMGRAEQFIGEEEGWKLRPPFAQEGAAVANKMSDGREEDVGTLCGGHNDTLGIVLCLEADSVKLSCSDAAGNVDAGRAIGSDSEPPPGTTLNGTLSDGIDIVDTPGDMFGIFGRAEDVPIMYKKGAHQDIGGRAEDAAIDFSMEVDIVCDDKEYFVDEDEENHTLDACSTFSLSEQIRQEETWDFANTEAIAEAMIKVDRKTTLAEGSPKEKELFLNAQNSRVESNEKDAEECVWLETEPPHLALPQDNASGEMEITNEISSEKYFDIQKIESESEAHIVRESKDLSVTDETPEERDEKNMHTKKGLNMAAKTTGKEGPRIGIKKVCIISEDEGRKFPQNAEIEQAERSKQAEKSLEDTAVQRIKDTNLPWYDDDLSSMSATAKKGQTIVEEDIDQKNLLQGFENKHLSSIPLTGSTCLSDTMNEETGIEMDTSVSSDKSVYPTKEMSKHSPTNTQGESKKYDDLMNPHEKAVAIRQEELRAWLAEKSAKKSAMPTGKVSERTRTSPALSMKSFTDKVRVRNKVSKNIKSHSQTAQQLSDFRRIVSPPPTHLQRRNLSPMSLSSTSVLEHSPGFVPASITLDSHHKNLKAPESSILNKINRQNDSFHTPISVRRQQQKNRRRSSPKSLASVRTEPMMKRNIKSEAPRRHKASPNTSQTMVSGMNLIHNRTTLSFYKRVRSGASIKTSFTGIRTPPTIAAPKSIANKTTKKKKTVPLYNGRHIVKDWNPKERCSQLWDPHLHATRKGCERCLHIASANEVREFERKGHHLRINLVRGGCHRGCSYFQRKEDEHPARLCHKCFYDTHELKLL